MPNEITTHAIAVWVVWGFAMGLGWAIATWLIGRVLKWMP